MKKMKLVVLVVAFIAAFISLNTNAAYAQNAVITGKVNFEGEAPAAKPINFGAERQCALVHGDKKPVEESIVVNPDKTVKGALVYIKEGITGQYQAPAEAVEIDQTGCIFIPHVSAAMVGQKVNFKNSDELLHNVRTNSKINKIFNIAQPVKNMTTSKKFVKLTLTTTRNKPTLTLLRKFWTTAAG